MSIGWSAFKSCFRLFYSEKRKVFLQIFLLLVTMHHLLLNMEKVIKVVNEVSTIQACSIPDASRRPGGYWLPAGATHDSWTNNSFLSSPMNNYLFLCIDLLHKCIAEEYPESESCIQYIYRDIRIIRNHGNTGDILCPEKLNTDGISIMTDGEQIVL